MSTTTTRRVAMPADLVALTKPGIAAMSVLMAAGALALAPGDADLSSGLLALFGIAGIVGAASALNMVIERDVDALMERTRDRPLPGRRLAPRVALIFGLVLAASSLVVLYLADPLTAGLGALALAIYVLVYTPLKRKTTASLLIGAVPGAMPALMGWTAATSSIDPAGMALFLVVFVWQLPHFLAIAIFRKDEYERAGILVTPAVRGEAEAWKQTVGFTAALIPTSLALVTLDAASWGYATAAAVAGLWLLALALRGRRQMGHPPARRYFRATLAYLPALVVGLAIDVALFR